MPLRDNSSSDHCKFTVLGLTLLAVQNDYWFLKIVVFVFASGVGYGVVMGIHRYNHGGASGPECPGYLSETEPLLPFFNM
jgi:hypothetical protein